MTRIRTGHWAACLCLLFLWQSHLAAQPVALTNVDILDLSGADAQLRRDQSVIVNDGIITAVATTGELDLPADARHIDGDGGTLIPGLIDSHVHIWDRADLPAYLSYGITTVRNMSGMPYLLDYQQQIGQGQLTGPRLLTTGPILNSPGPNAQLNHQLVETPDAAREAVHWQYARGFRTVKVYSNLSRAAYEAILDEADILGMAITGHPPEGKREPGIPEERPFDIAFDELLDDDFVTLEHVESIVWHALYDRQDHEALQQLAGRLAAAGVTVSPTLVAHHNLVRAASEKDAFVSRPGTELMNPFLAQVEAPLVASWTALPPGTRKDYDAFYADAVRAFQDAGVRMVAGSDAGIFVNIPGQSLLDELDLLVGAGLSPAQALRTATTQAAAALGLDDLGRIAAGYRAELLLLPGNPLDDMTVLQRPRGLMYQDEWFDAEALAALRREAIATADAARTEAQVMSALAEQQSLAMPQGTNATPSPPRAQQSR